MQKDKLKKIIENWVTKRLNSIFVYYASFLIFLFLFAYIFYVNINSSSFVYLFLYSFIPSFVVATLSFLLFRRYFLLFFGFLVLIIPITIFSLIVYTLFIPVSSYGYALYTNNFTGKCNVKVIDYKKGLPWYTKKGCDLSEDSRDVIRRYSQVGGSAMIWKDICKDLRSVKNEFSIEYNRILEKNKSFDLVVDFNKEFSTTTKEFILINKIKNFEKEKNKNLYELKKDVPNITLDNLPGVCSVDHFYLDKYKVF